MLPEKLMERKEVYELAKYSAKDTDYLINREVFTVFYKALKGKQKFNRNLTDEIE